MKKICYITTISLTLKMFVLKVAEYIHENTDWEITFICDNDEEFEKSLPEYIHFFPIHMERGISISGFTAMIQMCRFFKKQKFDLIQYSTPNASLYASLAGKLTRIPVRLYCQWGVAYVGFTGVKKTIFKGIEKLVCSLSTWIEPDSKSNLEFSHKEGLYPESKGSVIGNGSACGVNLNKFDISKKESFRYSVRRQYGIPEDGFVFGFVGRVTRDKGINELLLAFKSIIEIGCDSYLLIVGPDELDSTVDSDLYVWSKSTCRVLYTGFSEKVEQMLSAMDCYILPSYREGFGMGVVEAEAMGVPVIVTDIPGPIDGMVNGLTGLTVPVKDVHSLREAMLLLLKNPDMRYSMGNEAVKYIRDKFDQRELLNRICEDRKDLLSV